MVRRPQSIHLLIIQETNFSQQQQQQQLYSGAFDLARPIKPALMCTTSWLGTHPKSTRMWELTSSWTFSHMQKLEKKIYDELA